MTPFGDPPVVRVWSKAELANREHGTSPLHLSHFATCPARNGGRNPYADTSVQEDLFSTPSTLADPAEGARRRDEGMQRAEDAAEEDFKKAYADNLVAFTHSGEVFTSEDVLIRTLEQGYDTKERRCTGPIISRALALGTIINLGYGRAKRAELHRCPKAIYVGAQAADTVTCEMCGRGWHS